MPRMTTSLRGNRLTIRVWLGDPKPSAHEHAQVTASTRGRRFVGTRRGREVYAGIVVAERRPQAAAR